MKKICFVITALFLFAMLSCSAKKAQISLQNGVQQFDQQNFEEAIEELTKAIKRDSKLAEAYAYRARAYYYMGAPDQGLADANNAIKIKPELAMGYLARGINSFGTFYDDDDCDRVITDFDEAIRLDPSLAEAYYNRGSLYHWDKGDFDRALADYAEAIRLDPGFVEVYYNRGLIYENKKDYDRAIADYETALEFNPDDSYARDLLAHAQELQRRQQQQRNRAARSGSAAQDGVYTLSYPSKVTTKTGITLYKAPIGLMQAVGTSVYINIYNPQKLGVFSSIIRVTTPKNFWGLYQIYEIDDDGKPGGLVYNVVDALVID